jgi:hypothetical protein
MPECLTAHGVNADKSDPRTAAVTDPSTADNWTTELGGQTRPAGPAQPLAVVRDAWRTALGRAD